MVNNREEHREDVHVEHEFYAKMDIERERSETSLAPSTMLVDSDDDAWLDYFVPSDME
jgi:hypothetical protein